MARKTVRGKGLRAEAQAVEGASKKRTTVKKKETVARKKTTTGTSRASGGSDVRLKAYWGVFNQALKRVALFDHSQRNEADKKATELSALGKSPHFVQPVKEIVREESGS
jgi:hypothetical protein